MSIKITTLIENSLGEHLAMHHEHGVSFFIETKKGNILFDTGKSGVFIKNAEQLNIDLSTTKHIVLSHGHYDHTGGFREFIKAYGNSFKLHIGKDFFDKKYGYNGIAYQFLGNNFEQLFLQENNIQTNYITEPIVEILPKVFVATGFKRSNSFEKVNKRFYKYKDERYELDHFDDEVVVAIETEKGLVVLLGCCHPGIVNILSGLIERTEKSIYAILGGTHLVEADQERLEATIAYFDKIGVEIFGISHCTGEYATEKLKEKYKNKYFYNCTGTSIEFI